VPLKAFRMVLLKVQIPVVRAKARWEKSGVICRAPDDWIWSGGGTRSDPAKTCGLRIPSATKPRTFPPSQLGTVFFEIRPVHPHKSRLAVFSCLT
jgi:hypothetical protein